MSDFWATLAFQELVKFRVSAYNTNGWGQASSVNTDGARVRTVPRFMNPVVRDAATNDQQMFVYWSQLESLADMGDSEIISYGLEWDNGSSQSVWTPLQGYMSNQLLTEFISQDVTRGTAYSFRLQSRNVYGWGAYSSITLIAAAGIPA